MRPSAEAPRGKKKKESIPGESRERRTLNN